MDTAEDKLSIVLIDGILLTPSDFP